LAEKRANIVVLEPFTKISSFDGIGYAAQRALIGSVGGHLFPEEKDNEKRTKFYASPAGRRNKQKVAQLVSEVYSYLNSIIAEHADPRQYYFRLLVRMELNDKTGEILGEPYFDVDVFRHIGKIGGKPKDAKGFLLKVIFVGKEDVPVAKTFIKGVSELKKNTDMVDFKPYDDYLSAPKEVRDRITNTLPYLIINNVVYKVKAKMDEVTCRFTPYIDDEGETIEFNNENDVGLFILKKMPIKPTIFGSETAFEKVDSEISGFSAKIVETTKEIDDADTFRIASLGIDNALEKLDKKLSVDTSSASAEMIKALAKQKEDLDEFRANYEKIKASYEATEEELKDLSRQRNEGTLEEDKYLCTKKRRLIALSTMRSDLIKVSREMKDKLQPDIQHTLRQVNKTIKEAKVIKPVKVGKVNKSVKAGKKIEKR
jgi:hypothetical protein